MIEGLQHRVESYSDGSNTTKLNTVDVWQPNAAPAAQNENRLWIVYIHGGAWRDPEVDSASFEPAIKVLWDSSSRDSFAGFASINYSLSPYPSHKTNPSTPEDPSRNVHHPRHVLDVAHALVHLEGQYQISSRYILVGHSAGATMAFQFHQALIPGTSLPRPSGVLGIAGIYHFEAFVEAHSGIPAYKELMENAFPDRTLWEDASPYSSSSEKDTLWGNTRTVIVSHSEEDELVEKAQASFMLERARSVSRTASRVYFLEASGLHDQIWSSGHILASLVVKTMGLVTTQVESR